MKSWNITQLNFTNEEFHQLCDSYTKILILICGIDGKVDRKEVEFLITLITRRPWEGNEGLIKMVNHFEEDRNLKNRFLELEDDYIRLFELENIIFFEIEKSLRLVLDRLEDKSNMWINKTLDYKLDRMKESIEKIKSILESRKDLIGEKFIKDFYIGLYLYLHKIASLVGKGFLGHKIVKEEEKALELFKELVGLTYDEVRILPEDYKRINRNYNLKLEM